MTALVPLVVVAGCSGFLNPGSHCEQEFGIDACLPTLETAPNTDIVVTLENRTSGPVRLDTCSIQLTGRVDPSVPFNPSYDPRRRCGSDVTPDEILRSSLVIGGNQRLDVTLRIPAGLPQGQYRFHFWFVRDTGDLMFEEPVKSRVFDVFPSAD